MKDVFICHASEDKEEVVRPLVNSLEKYGITCWVDEGEVDLGESFVRKINEAISNVHYFTVIFSDIFLTKNWAKREINALIDIEASTGQEKILPIYVGNQSTLQSIKKMFPLLRDKQFINWDKGIPAIVKEISKRLQTKKTDKEESAVTEKKDDLPYLPKIKKQFSQRDKDQFLNKAFETIKSYFQKALKQLQESYPEIDTDFLEVNKLKFISKVYSNGDLKTQCKIWIDSSSSYNSIGYLEGLSNIDNDSSFNEQVTVQDDGFKMQLRFLIGYPAGQLRDTNFQPDKAAEELWKRFTSPLER